MGLYQALVSSKLRFKNDLPPLGYAEKAFHWSIELPLNKDGAVKIGGPYRRQNGIWAQMPDRQRSGQRTTVENTKPLLTADQPVYVLPLSEDSLEHRGFLKLHRDLLKFCEERQTEGDDDLICAVGSLIRLLEDDSSPDHIVLKRLPFRDKDILRFTTADRALSDYVTVREFWAQRLGEMESTEIGVCGTCGSEEREVQLLQKMPVQLRLFDYLPPITSFKPSSFDSYGKDQMNNSPVCVSCGMNATAVLSYLLLNNGRVGKHSLVLAKQSKRSGTARPLSNQIAVFWTKDEVTIQRDGHAIPAEQAIRLSLDDDEGSESTYTPKANEAHIKALLDSPWYCRGSEVSQVSPIGFYFAILSPNKSRLVIREWLETSIATVKDCLVDYRRAMSIINLADGMPFVPPLTSILTSLRGPASKRNPHDENPRLAEIEPELLRQMIRCMYAGAAPPEALLVRAVQAFRAPVTAADEGESFKRLCDRRSALAAAMKFVITYNNTNNTKAMEQLETSYDADCAYKRQSSYLCGRLLALLNDIQYRSSTSRRGPNTTLVDKFYAAASTAPQSVFGSLLKQANTAHLPKLRKDSSRNYAVKTSQGDVYVTDLLNEIVNLIDATCGLPKQLTPRQQAEFALGYHHQQAVLRPPSVSKSVESKPEQNSTSNQ